MKKPTKIIFISASPFAIPVLETLISKSPDDSWKLIKVITQPDKPSGRGKKVLPNEIKKSALEHHIPVINPQKIGDAIQEIKALDPELIIVSDYAQKIPPTILELPKFGCLNIHFSLLPKYRGPSPVQFTILNDEKETGISIFIMDEKFDTGNLLFQESMPVNPNDTTENLAKKLYQKTAESLPQFLNDYFDGKIKPWSQNHPDATYTRYLKKEDGKINWNDSDEKIERMIRAFYPWPVAWTIWNNKRLKILKSHLDENGKLVLDRVQLEGKKEVSFEDFKRGYPDFDLEELKTDKN